MLSQIQGVKVAAVSDVAEEKAKKVASLVGARPYSDYRTMLRAEACMDFENRWLPAFRAIKLAVSEGTIGEPVYASAMLSDRIDVPLEMWGPPERSWVRGSTCADFLLSRWTDLVRRIIRRDAEKLYAVSHSKKLSLTPGFIPGHNALGDLTSHFESSWILSRVNQPSLAPP